MNNRRWKYCLTLEKLCGEKVIAKPKNSQDGLYYQGIMIRILNIRHSLVHFDFHQEGKAELVPSRYIIPISGAVAVPRLKVDNLVLVRMMHGASFKECFVPGIVKVLPRPLIDKSYEALYTVVLHNEQKVTCLRKDMIKVGHCDYIVHTVADLPVYFPSIRKGEIPQSGSYLRMNESKSSDSGVDSEGGEGQTDSRQKNQKEKRRLYKHELQERGKDLPVKATQTLLLKQKPISSPESDQSQTLETFMLLEMRRSLQPICEQENVLAHWPDDGWYYTGHISKNNKDYSYDVCDNTGYSKRIWREDIIVPRDDTSSSLKVTDHVVALHPGFKFSYAPGKVTAMKSTGISVEFYDGERVLVNTLEVFKLPKQKYDHDVKEIVKIGDQWVGKHVIIPDKKYDCYNIGTVIEKLKPLRKHSYAIEFCDGRRTNESIVHMFGAVSHRPQVETGDKILAFYDSISDRKGVPVPYLPGLVKGKDGAKVQVEFCDGKITNKVDENHSFWLSDTYYEHAVRMVNRNSVK